MSGLKKRKTTHHLGWAWSRGERPGIGWERSEWLRAAWRPGGHPGRPGGGQPDFGPRRAGVGPQCRGAGVTDGGQGARRRRGSDRGEAGRRPQGSQTPEPGSIVVGAEGRGSKTALETREAAPWSLSRRVPGEASASRPSRASGASYSGDEEPSGHPAQIAAAAGRLHCLTITRAGFSPRPANPRDPSLEERAPSSRSQKETARATAVQGGSHGGLTRLGPRCWLLGRLPSDAKEAGCHSDSARGGSRGPRPARRIAPSAAGDTGQAFPCK
ncbi:zinc finger protein 664 isoform X2 [Bos indicus x Bos taurus]|uniref:zinc finger protein 664 isoform X2 n=1 Tax=Bos indicus x Bos taurus TaxID=30522 RepID=UPI000F7D385E|nr:zinc finger protein 664 isoform X2 [Bos indicus x Bos taurus]